MTKRYLLPAVWMLAGVMATLLYLHREALETQVQAQSMATPTQTVAANSQSTFPSRSPAPVELTPEELANIRVYEVANRSVVNIDTQTEQVDPFFMRRMQGAGSGSGSVLDKQGHILTNAHVIENARSIEVTLASGQTYPADLVGQDREHDVAVLKIEAPSGELYPLELGRSDGLRVGQQVYALGNPFGLEGSLTKGIISSLNRSIEGRTGREMKSLVQTDAAMNPGNSGGPLLDSHARMVGMNVAIATRTGQNTGVGFAIPANRISAIVPELIEHGRIIRPDHGILGLREYTDRGVKIEAIRPGGPADKAGLQAIVQLEIYRQGNTVYKSRTSDVSRGDWLVAVDGKKVETASDFLAIMDSYNPGQTVNLTIMRNGREQDVKMTLGEG
ncbi:trypsin-like peptidase domain-containing protein [Aeoliella sp. ICT_H6.2]|uniref:Trypsin-like peptidase domain-containing protein n=1 Tax=Aeoliella straminimaris TaxID=2954799 RepID=A0A9X2FB40_9BACT|nr:trypsin-like peptidase domain-containing protein [Aeoliella straminimaris]MCO6044918.1 trypsin-like peptidase domain-containing protein [Aeoliella straminimaris]